MGLFRALVRALLSKPRHRDIHHVRDLPPIQQVAAPSPWEAARTIPARQFKGHAWVIDGDTIVIDRVHIRIAGIDAPELDQPYGQVAKSALMRLCKGRIVTAVCAPDSSYDRHVAVCHLDDGRDLAAEMVSAGLALDWAKHSGGRYRSLEADGQRRKLWRVEAKHRGKMPPTNKSHE